LEHSTSHRMSDWELQRSEILRQVAVKLTPMCEVSARRKIRLETHRRIAQRAALRLESMITMAPYRVPGSAVSSTDSTLGYAKVARVMACVMGDRDAPTVFAFVNEHGDLIDTISLLAFHSRVPRPGDRDAGPRPHSHAERQALEQLAERKATDASRLHAFVRTHRPHLVVLAAAGEACLPFLRDIEHAVKLELADTVVTLVDAEVGRVYMNSDAARRDFPDRSPAVRQAISLARRAQDPLAEISSLWTEELSGSGTRLTDVSGNLLLSLRLHPLQGEVPSELLAAHCRRVLIDVTNQVGCDINQVVVRPWLLPLLSNVCGLGIRKATAILDKIRGSGHGIITNRRQLKQFVGNVVYKNAAGFIRLRYDELGNRSQRDDEDEDEDEDDEVEDEEADDDDDEEAGLDEDEDVAMTADAKAAKAAAKAEKKAAAALLRKQERQAKRDAQMARPTFFDATRIHPDNYGWAFRVVVDALDYTELPPNLSLESPSPSVMRLLGQLIKQLRAPGKLGELDRLVMQAFAIELETEGKGKNLTVLNAIVTELKSPFRDSVRRPWTPLSPIDQFYAVSGESEATCRVGLPVECSVVRTARGIAVTRLGSGVRGVLRIDAISEDQRYPDAADHDARDRFLASLLPVGSAVTCRILRIQYGEGEVELTAKKSIVAARRRDERFARQLEELEELAIGAFEDCFDSASYFNHSSQPERDLIQARQKDQATQALKQRYLPRTITHPAFRNCSSAEAIEDLGTRDVGECIIRPSTQGVDHLTLSWRFTDEQVLHVDIQESQKSTPQALGKVLRIAGVSTPFEDLDHILDGYVGTLNRYIHDLVNSDKFLHGNAIDVDQILRTRKQQEPSKMHYAFWMDANKPGTVCVSYLKHVNVRTENVSVSMNGFHFRGKPQPSPAHLAAALKKMCVEQDQQAAAAAVQAQAAAQQAAADAAARARIPYGHHQPPHYAVRRYSCGA
jgi:hypothetical protein